METSRKFETIADYLNWEESERRKGKGKKKGSTKKGARKGKPGLKTFELEEESDNDDEFEPEEYYKAYREEEANKSRDQRNKNNTIFS